MAKKDTLGPLTGVVEFVVLLVPLLVGAAATGLAVGEPTLEFVKQPAVNLFLGWLLVIAGIFSVYTFFTKK